MVFLNPKANNTYVTCYEVSTEEIKGRHSTGLFFFSQAKIHFMKYAAPLFHLSGMDVTVVEVGLSLDGFANMESMRVCRRSYSLVPRVLVHFQYASTKGLSLWTVQSQVPFHTEWHELQSQVQDFFQGGMGGAFVLPWLWLASPPPWIC